MLKIKNLSYSYNSLNLLKNLNLHFDLGVINCIYGNNGKGKSTLINIISSYLTDYDGDILYQGNNIKNLTKDDWRSKLSVAHQSPYLYPDTLWNNLCLGNISTQKILALTNLFNISEFIEKNKNKVVGEYFNLSGGQQQLISIIRSISSQSEILLLDEPTSNLDKRNKQLFLNLLNEIKHERLIIMVSHDNTLLSESRIHYF